MGTSTPVSSNPQILRGVSIKEGLIGANVAGDGREFGMIFQGVVVDALASSGSALLRRLNDADALGINPAYDLDNGVNVYRHISEFYRMAGEGHKLHIVIVDQNNGLSQMISGAKYLVLDADGSISDIAFVFNPIPSETETFVNGINAGTVAAIPLLQAFAQWADENDMPLHTIVEGRNIGPLPSAFQDLRDMTDDYNKVSVVIGQDWNYAENLTGLTRLFADVGTFLGVIASQPWNRNPGEVVSQNLTNSVLGAWIVAGLSNHLKYGQVYSDLGELDGKGYIFPMKYNGTTGYWWNDGHVCSSIVNDSAGNINQHMIYYSHTIDEAKRALRTAFLPEVKKTVPLDGGKLPASMVGYYNAIGDAVFERMAGKGLISDGRTYVDPESDLLIEKVLKIQFSVVPTGCVNSIVGTINLKNK